MSLKRLTGWKLLPLWGCLTVLGTVLLFGDLGCIAVNPNLPRENGQASNVPTQVIVNGSMVPASSPPTGGVAGVAFGSREDIVVQTYRDAEPAGPFADIRSPLGVSKETKPKTENAPVVWKRDRNRPSFARVYVGDGNSLELVNLRVTVTVEGPRARTVVDHVFYNPHDRRLEGTFEYPLPTGASPAHFAMYLGSAQPTVATRFRWNKDGPPLPDLVLADGKTKDVAKVKDVETYDWGKLQEARVVGKDKALETYEEVVRGKIDPALLEYAGGNTFSGRVFPIQAKGFNRVILAYEETLPVVGDDLLYRYPMPDCKLTELEMTLDANVTKGQVLVKKPDARDWSVAEQTTGETYHFQHIWTEHGPGGEAVFKLTPANANVQAVAGRQGESGPRYVYARVRPDLKAERADPFASKAVFLLDTSLSEHPDRFNVSMKLLRRILENDPEIKQFNVLTFDVAARWLTPTGFLDNTKEGRETAFKRLDGILLEGATDVSAALNKLCQPGFAIDVGTPLNVFLLSDGQATWGEANVGQMVASFESRCPYPTRFHCYRTGLGADNAELFEALTRRGGGVFNCFGDGELVAAAQAHRNQCFQVESVHFEGGQAMSDILIAGRKACVYPGGDLVVAARLAGDKTPSAHAKTTLVVEGKYLGQKHVEEYTVELTPGSDLAARAWGEVAVASLLAVNDPKLDPLVTAYCQQFGIGSRVASFLVLENDADYKRLNLEAERGKTVNGDLGSFLEGVWVNLGKPATAKQLFERFLERIEPRVKLTEGSDAAHVKKVLTLLADADFELPDAAIGGKPFDKKQVPAEYLKKRKEDPRNVANYLAEARRRAEAGDDEGAARVLSCVVEEYPGRADALRLVGYRLLDFKQPASAARLFEQVERNRPFEPHSYRDLARSLEESGKYGLAAIQYEIVLAGTWHNRFHDSLKVVAREEYVQMMQQAVQKKAVAPKLLDAFGDRLEGLKAAREPSDLRVSISWNTDATDVDLWVIEPDGTKVFYQNKRSPSGGELSEDQTQGYGPERYRIAKAKPGVYKVVVHNFNPNPNLLGGETHVHIVITRNAGTPGEVSERHNVILKTPKEEVEVAKVKF